VKRTQEFVKMMKLDLSRSAAFAVAFSAALAGCAGPAVYQRQGAQFDYPVSDTQALAQCKADALRDFHNSRDHSIFDALDIGTPIRICMAGKGYAAE
jgi:hypothetical protein